MCIVQSFLKLVTLHTNTWESCSPLICLLFWCMHGKSLQSCLTLCDSMDCSPPGSSVHGIFQARILEWVAISFSRGSSWPRDWNHISCIGRRILYHCATWEAQEEHVKGRILLLWVESMDMKLSIRAAAKIWGEPKICYGSIICYSTCLIFSITNYTKNKV